MSKYALDIMVLGPIQTNVYIVSNEETRECIVIDPAAKSQQIMERIMEKGLTLKAMLLTHGHFDHLLAVKGIKENCPDVPVYAHEKETPLIARPRSASLGVDFSQYGFTPDILVKDGEVLDLIGFSFKVFNTPGHSIGSVCYYIESEKVLFAGDTVFAGSYGRTDLETGSGNDIIESFRNVVFKFSDETVVYPGHGPETTIQYEKKYNDILMYLK